MSDDLARARELLGSAEEPTRLRGVHLLRDRVADRAAASALLVETLADPGSYVPHAARAALTSLRADAHCALLDGLGDSREVVRVGCVWAVALPHEQGVGRLLDAVCGLAADPEPAVRNAVAAALGRMEADVDLSTRVLQELALDRDPVVRAQAVSSMGLADPLGEACRDRLLAALDDGKASVRAAAARSLHGVAPEPIEVSRVREALAEEADEAARLLLAGLLERWEGRP